MAETTCCVRETPIGEVKVRGIKLRRLEIRYANHWHLRGYRLRIEVAEINGEMPREVFVYQRRPLNPHDGTHQDDFCTVAGVVDLAEYPVGEPTDNGTYPFFRLDYIEVDVRSLAHAQEVWETVQREVCNLIAALARYDILVEVESSWCGDEPVASETPSESVSSSASTSV